MQLFQNTGNKWNVSSIYLEIALVHLPSPHTSPSLTPKETLDKSLPLHVFVKVVPISEHVTAKNTSRIWSIVPDACESLSKVVPVPITLVIPK